MRRLITIACATSLTACVAVQELPYEVQAVPAAAETTAMAGRGDRADDPAVWVHPDDPGRSLILGTNKSEGLYVYALDGEELQRLLIGQVNNVDVRGSLAVASNDEFNGLSWFRISAVDETSPVSHLGNTPVMRAEPYGVCLGRVSGRLLAGVTYKDGAIELWAVNDGNDRGLPEVSLARTVHLSSQLEGCVFDDANDRLFIGEEAIGIWTLDVADEESHPRFLDTIASGQGLVPDVEGLSLYLGTDGGGYLVASAQSADRFVIYERRPPHRLIGAITIVSDSTGSIDAVTHTDGLDILALPLPGYPKGILVVQDDGNPQSGVDQNFKIVDWQDVDQAIRRLRQAEAGSTGSE
jgi:3-phytase